MGGNRRQSNGRKIPQLPKKFLTGHEIERFAKQARALLSDFGNDAVAVKRAEFLQESLEAYESAARTGHSRFRGHGILEAMIGTLAWTLTLIFFRSSSGTARSIRLRFTTRLLDIRTPCAGPEAAGPFVIRGCGAPTIQPKPRTFSENQSQIFFAQIFWNLLLVA